MDSNTSEKKADLITVAAPDAELTLAESETIRYSAGWRSGSLRMCAARATARTIPTTRQTLSIGALDLSCRQNWTRNGYSAAGRPYVCQP